MVVPNNYQTLPFCEDSEKGVLCSLIRDPAFVSPLLGRISPDAFYIPAHQILFQLFLEWEHPERPIDFFWAKRRLDEIGQLQEVGQKEGLNEFWSFVPTHLNAACYIETVAEKYALRRCQLLFDKISSDCGDRGANPGLILANAERQLTEIKRLTIRKSLRGASILDFSQREINAGDTLLAKRYLWGIRAGDYS